MSMRPAKPGQRGMTLIEILVVFAVVALILVLAAPSFSSIIDLQRLRGTNDQVVTDVQFMRTEAASRQELTGITFRENGTMTCYTIHTCGGLPGDECECECTAAAGSRCAAPRREVRTVQLLKSAKVMVRSVSPTGVGAAPERVVIDPATGSMEAHYPVVLVGLPPDPIRDFRAETSLIDNTAIGTLQTRLSAQGRPSICSPGGQVKGPLACP